jgi:hypothetical protein
MHPEGLYAGFQGRLVQNPVAPGGKGLELSSEHLGLDGVVFDHEDGRSFAFRRGRPNDL